MSPRAVKMVNICGQAIEQKRKFSVIGRWFMVYFAGLFIINCISFWATGRIVELIMLPVFAGLFYVEVRFVRKSTRRHRQWQQLRRSIMLFDHANTLNQAISSLEQVEATLRDL